MKYMKYEIQYKDIEMDKLQNAYDKYKDVIKNIEPFYLKEIIDKVSNMENYISIKSWRSNALEGNTTKLKNLKKIIDNDLRDQNNLKLILVSLEKDDEYEIVNLKKAYSIQNKYNLGSLENINYIIGMNIFKNDFNKLRGKLKTEENIIQHKVDHELTTYEVNFCHPSKTKVEIKKLLNFLKTNLTEDLTFSNAFVLATIFNIEFNRIHPFADGNGRTGRVVMEKIFEDYGFVPLIFARENSKSIYKKTLFESDKQEDKYNYDLLVKTFASLYNDEIKELNVILEKMKL